MGGKGIRLQRINVSHTYECKKCVWTGSETAARLHTKLHHNGSKFKPPNPNNQCIQCGFETKCIKSLKEHVRNTHI